MKSLSKTARPQNIDEYIQSFPKNIKDRLISMRKHILKVAPKAEESLKWGMPAFSYDRILVTFKAFKNHIGFYPTPSALKAFRKKLSDYKTGEGSIQFPHDKPLPLKLIEDMTAYRVLESKKFDAKWKPT
jgi:uncharacterized protein YdhG (YjbR/CyaY superfamily)